MEKINQFSLTKKTLPKHHTLVCQATSNEYLGNSYFYKKLAHLQKNYFSYFDIFRSKIFFVELITDIQDHPLKFEDFLEL